MTTESDKLCQDVNRSNINKVNEGCNIENTTILNLQRLLHWEGTSKTASEIEVRSKKSRKFKTKLKR